MRAHAPARIAAATLTVDLETIARNTAALAGLTRGELIAVVKADGFGHGAVLVARTALANGASRLGVASVEEALALRGAGIAAPVLSWLNPLGADFGAAIGARVELAVPSIAHLRAIAAAASAAGTVARVHLHADVGMARDGASADEWTALVDAARAAEYGRLIEVSGVMGHLACADVPGHPSNAAGRAAFVDAVEIAQRGGLRPRVRHLAATAATLTDPATHFDAIRVGAGLYGIDAVGSGVVRGALRLDAPVVSVRDVPAGTPVGYGHAYVTTEPTRLALVALGYADGIPRAASGRGEVLVHGRRMPLVGTVSMDQFVIDVGTAAVEAGDAVTVLGAGDDGEPTVPEWSAWAGTIPNEIMTGFGTRVARVHAGSGAR